MLRELIAWVLNNYLGKYVGNLNTAQLTVALLSGEVELENLPLRRDALRNLGLPLQALSGSIGKIKLQVPVRQFRTAPWCILIEKVYVVVGPVNLNEWDPDIEEQADLDFKLTRLDRLEAKWRAQKEAAIEGGYYASSYSGWMSYGTSLVTNIVENLQLKINDVHIRYEDTLTVQDHRFACGVTIESLSAQSCDPNWIAGFTSNWSQHSAAFKLVELQNLSFYWDPLTNFETFGNTSSSELAEAILKNKNQWSHHYLISPVCAQAKLKRDRSETPLRTRSRPRLVCDLVLNEVSLSLIDWQYNQMVECIKGLDDIAKFRRFRLLRPRTLVKENPKAWWDYALKCNGFFFKKFKFDRSKILEDKKYIDIYTRVILNPSETLSIEDKDTKDKVERERYYEAIVHLREYCYRCVPVYETEITKPNPKQGGTLSQWFPQWWYSSASKAAPTEVVPVQEQKSNGSQESKLIEEISKETQFEDEILNALANDTVDTNSLLKRDSVFGKFDFTLKKGTLDICTGTINTDKTSMIQLLFENLLLNIESRPRSASHFIGLSLGAVLLKDCLTPNTDFSELIKPQFSNEPDPKIERTTKLLKMPQKSQKSKDVQPNAVAEPLFILHYEQKPLSYNTDYRLFIKSQSLDIVYNTEAFKWIVDFICKPHQITAARRKIEAMKNETKMKFMKNWETIMEGINLSERKTWTLEIDISAPQIIFAENLTNKNDCVVVVDFGRLQLTNGDLQSMRKKSFDLSEMTQTDASEEDEMFATPCSTPPGSPSITDSPTLQTACSELLDLSNCTDGTLNEGAIHDKIYERYNLDLTELQVIVCKGRERLSFASAKGTSALHVLDRFNISLQVERRIVYTSDPQYPSLTMAGTLPKLVVHVNEQKIAAITNVLNLVTSNDSQSPYRSPTTVENVEPTADEISDESSEPEFEIPKDTSKLILLQFNIDQMALEVQSRGRSIAELQVTGVKAGLRYQPSDISITLSVHGLLLVDAIQSFGADFELLMASHRHVGMDSVSGSLKQSEPCSPSSPASPDPLLVPRRPTSPHSISKALNNLQRAVSPIWNASLTDKDALIIIDVTIITPENDADRLHVANIQFNNLDIIANQETIVELIGFTNRVFPKKKTPKNNSANPTTSATSDNFSTKQEITKINNDGGLKKDENVPIRTEITFDFHRLNVLVLRALMRDNYMVGRKVGTFTMSEARIHATLGNEITVEGSLGGLQVLDLTPEGINHQRILSVGKDPLTEPPNIEQDLLSSLTQEMYLLEQHKTEKALSFSISRNLNASVNIKIRMASVWYTHCARFMQELSWCATEFKQYIKNLAKSIREKATDMALGLVQPRTDLNATTSRQTEVHSPYKSFHPYASSHHLNLRHDHKKSSKSKTKVTIKLDVVLDTPVLVLPRSSCSPHVLVAHLGKISVNNNKSSSRQDLSSIIDEKIHIDRPMIPINEEIFPFDDIDGITEQLTEEDDNNSITLTDKLDHDDSFGIEASHTSEEPLDTYMIDIRNMNLYSLDTSHRKRIRLSALPRAEEFYSCQEDAVAIVHDTAIRLEVTRFTDNANNLYIESIEPKDTLLVTGSVIKPLRLSMSRRQFEQLLETIDNIFKVPSDLVKPPTDGRDHNSEDLSDKVDEDDIDSFEFDKSFKRRLNYGPSLSESKSSLEPKVSFELPIFVIQLQNEINEALIEISFRDFNVNFEKNNQYETNVQISLRSILMEDLLCPVESKNRSMVTSSSPDNLSGGGNVFISHSCPNFAGVPRFNCEHGSSLPDNLENRFSFFNQTYRNVQQTALYPGTPPPSPQPKTRQDNLVIYSSLLVDPDCPTFLTQYNGLRQSSSIDFNCLNLIVSVKSWLVVLNFFGLLSDDDDTDSVHVTNQSAAATDADKTDLKRGNSELEISIRSLTLVLVRGDYEMAKANVSNAHFIVSKKEETKTVEGRLGSVSLYDLTSHGSIYREKFVTSGSEALNFVYMRDGPRLNSRSLANDAKLKIQMSSVRYVHTKRFIAEIQEFFTEFSQLQAPVLRKIKPTESRYDLYQKPTQLCIIIKAGSPIILLPMSSKSNQIIVADLGEFSLENSFHYSNEKSIISVKSDTVNDFNEILDVMMVDLVNTDLFTGLRVTKNDNGVFDDTNDYDVTLDMGGYVVVKNGRSLLNNKCHLKLRVERNMDTWKSHNIPDISVYGTLSKLEADLSLPQYKLVRGFLSYNLGECIDDVYVSDLNLLNSFDFDEHNENINTTDANRKWNNLSITLELQDVSVKLQLPDEQKYLNNTNLACVHFIKSFLKIDSFSDGSQDIDLVSQEILINDSRNFSVNNNNNMTEGDEHYKQKNVFTNILKPIYKDTEKKEYNVQAEIHSRRRKDQVKYIVLLNNMRLMAILDWLEIVLDFLSQSEEYPPTHVGAIKKSRSNEMNKIMTREHQQSLQSVQQAEQIELILNVTDSELVFVEKPYKHDTNAIILKSTTVVSYRPHEINKVISINLNHLEVFSCILGSEDETALSIIDPVTINFDVKNGVLDIQLQKQLFIRLSYNDVKMFTRMLESLPKQTKMAKSNKELKNVIRVNQSSVDSLVALGFSSADCVRALEACQNQLSDAAIWLTQNASPIKFSPKPNPLKVFAVEVQGNCISLCVIDDCKDADVPLLEVSLSNLSLRQELSDFISTERSSFKAGCLKGVFASDYFNRALSGWEPLIEPWKCVADWNYSLGQLGTSLNRVQLKISSDELLKLNVTTTIIELFQLVKDNWIQDYYSSDSTNKMPIEIRRRTPFVPFAIKNETGLKLYFTKLVTPPGGIGTRTDVLTLHDNTWNCVEPGTTLPFTFGPQTKLRHHDTHKLKLHQIGVRVEGWMEVGPISVDRVGISFRHARHERYGGLPSSRIVFEITLQGSAQKLITVRSALRLYNRLNNPVLLKLEHDSEYLKFRKWPQVITTIVASNELYYVPLSHVHAYMYFKPIISQVKYDEYKNQGVALNQSPPISQAINLNGDEYCKYLQSNNSSFFNNFQFTAGKIYWKDDDDNEVRQEIRACPGNGDKKYRIVISSKKEGYPKKEHVPGHSITLWPPVRVHNLLPCDLLYKIEKGAQGRITQSETANIHEVDLDNEQLDINITLDSYPISGRVSLVTGYIGFFETDLRLFDTNNRLLNLKASIQISKESGIQITIYVQYWLINRTGLPLVYRQEGVSHDSSGQFHENEQARLVSPFLFSFADSDGSRSLIVRLGKRFGNNPPWCQPFNLFNLHKDILHRQLRSGSSNETFIVGIEVRRGRGRYSRTSVVTFSPRFQLYNRSSYRLQFAQKCYATSNGSTTAKSTIIDAISGCHLPFHWPRLDQEQELCVRLPEVSGCLWSGGVPINEAQSYYINIRDVHGQMYFLRLEIIMQGATYFLLFGNAQVLPPPIRIDNYSEVSIKFYQPDPRSSMDSRSKTTTVKPHSSIAYALDEPNGPNVLKFEAPGNVTQTYYLKELGQMAYNLTYENFIYIAFTGTFTQDGEITSDFDIDSQQLVLGVNSDSRVVLVRKQPGDRSQLWRMNNDKQLEHEGSSPPREYGKSNSAIIRYVLDIEKPPQVRQSINLVVRPANKQRRSTQTWHFTEEGRLMCEHASMCVQASGGFFGLRPGSEAVLGMIVSDSHVITRSLVPIEQAVERQKLRPGSGVLSVTIAMDGPIKTIQIKDVKFPNSYLQIDPSWKHASNIREHYKNSASSSSLASFNETDVPDNKGINEFNIHLKLIRGFGVSVISNRPRDEVCFVTLENITSELISTPSMRSLDLSIGDMQIDNQLFETPCPVTVFPIKSSNDSPTRLRLPVIQLNVKMLPGPNTNAVIYEHFILSIRPVSIYLEERLILRLADFVGMGNNIANPTSLTDESDFEAQNLATKLLAANAKRYYFGDLRISPTQIRLSVITASKLSPRLGDIKKSLGLTLIKFEDALIEFKQFTYKHHFETLEVYWRAIKSQYKKELKWQAASILGSVDFLGNPLGFANDLSEGVSGLLFEGSVKSLVKNVTHGLSNSTAKLTETLSDGLGRVVLDEEDTELRQRILEVPSGSNSTGEHLVAGFKGLGFGLLGGVTSIYKHTYVGVQSDGLYGFFSGFGKGVLGTVTKPVIGMLDLASETANAVRETSKSSNRILPERKRLPRCVTGAPGGLIPAYSVTQSKGQQHLFLINKRNFIEVLIAYEPCLYQSYESCLRLLVSSDNFYVFSRTEETTTIIISYNLSELLSCHPVSVVDEYQPKRLQHYIELCLNIKSTAPSAGTVKRPRVRCQTDEMAQKASRHINYAKGIYDERRHTLLTSD